MERRVHSTWASIVLAATVLIPMRALGDPPAADAPTDTSQTAQPTAEQPQPAQPNAAQPQSAPATEPSQIAPLAPVPETSLVATTRRDVPEYDGRAPLRPSIGDDLLWIPRVVLFPVWAVTEYGIRAPLSWVIRKVEEYHVPQRLAAVGQFGPNITFIPTLVIDLGLASSVGLHVVWQDAMVRGNHIHAAVATGGAGFWRIYALDRYTFAPRSSIGLTGEYLERSDWSFYGIGPDTNTKVFQDFNWARFDSHAFFEFAEPHHAGMSLTTGFRYDRFGERPALINPQMMPPGYDNHGVYYATARGYLDSRPYGAPDRTGARIEAAAIVANDLTPNTNRRWVNYEGEASLFLEVKRPGRVLGVSAYAAFADPLGSDPVPFVDLSSLGGWEHMRAWFYGRFRGSSATTFTMSYRYPVWWWLDGTVFVEAGNAWGAHLEGFDVRHMFGSLGLGFRTVGNRDASLDAILAIGSTRFDEPFGIDAVRVAVGVNNGF